jgi:hypothetical protein
LDAENIKAFIHLSGIERMKWAQIVKNCAEEKIRRGVRRACSVLFASCY